MFKNRYNFAKFMGVGSAVLAPSLAHASYTAPTDVASLWAIVDISNFQSQQLLMYGLGASMLLVGLGWYLLKSGSKKAIRGTL